MLRAPLRQQVLQPLGHLGQRVDHAGGDVLRAEAGRRLARRLPFERERALERQPAQHRQDVVGGAWAANKQQNTSEQIRTQQN